MEDKVMIYAVKAAHLPHLSHIRKEVGLEPNRSVAIGYLSKTGLAYVRPFLVRFATEFAANFCACPSCLLSPSICRTGRTGRAKLERVRSYNSPTFCPTSARWDGPIQRAFLNCPDHFAAVLS
jgi:hypothetical protein